MRRTIPLALTFIIGLYPIFAFFVPHARVSAANDWLDEALVIVAAFALKPMRSSCRTSNSQPGTAGASEGFFCATEMR